MNKSKFIFINVPMAAKGHQIGRLVSSCANVLWYDYYKNGQYPWQPGYATDATNLSKFHYDRRFRGSLGKGLDNYTIPPILETAIRNNVKINEELEIQSWNSRLSSFVTYPENYRLDDTRRIIPNSNHIVVIPDNVDLIVDRYMKTSSKYPHSRDSDGNIVTFREYWNSKNPVGSDDQYEEWVRKTTISLIDNYKTNYNKDTDYVIESVEELIDIQQFKIMCDKFGLIYDEESHAKVVKFISGDAYSPDVKVVTLRKSDIPLIEDFCKECSHLGYNNNSSLKEMKYQWCLDNGGKWFGVIENGKLISVSGVHRFMNGWRVNFRGCQLKSRPVEGLNRYHAASWPMHTLLPMGYDHAKISDKTEDPNIYITTNVEHDASGRMNRVHNSFFPMERAGMVECISEQVVYGKLQAIWKLNMKNYFDKRI